MPLSGTRCCRFYVRGLTDEIVLSLSMLSREECCWTSSQLLAVTQKVPPKSSAASTPSNVHRLGLRGPWQMSLSLRTSSESAAEMDMGSAMV